jgi:hypothetical protein
MRRHTILLPVFAELLLGQFSFAQVRVGSCVCAACAQLLTAGHGLSVMRGTGAHL